MADRVSNSALDAEGGDAHVCTLARQRVHARAYAPSAETASAHQNASAARVTARTDDGRRQAHSLAVAQAAEALSSSAARRHGQLSRPRRPRPLTVSATRTRASSRQTWQHTLVRATTSAVRSAWLSWQSVFAGGASVRPRVSRRRAAELRPRLSLQSDLDAEDRQLLAAAISRLGQPCSRPKRVREDWGE